MAAVTLRRSSFGVVSGIVDSVRARYTGDTLLPPNGVRSGIIFKRSVTSANPQAAETDVKDFDEIPGPKGLPVMGTTLENSSALSKWHLFHMKRFKTYGPIWKEQFAGPGLSVFIVSPEGVQEAMKYEGKYPYRQSTPPWEEYYKQYNKPRGLMLEQGKDWDVIRKTVDKPILRPNMISRHVPSMQTVARDAVARLASVRDSHGEITDINRELFKWALESACYTMYERRFGCLDASPPPYTAKFIDAVNGLFRVTGDVMFYPQTIVRLFMRKKWKQICDSFDVLTEVGTKTIKEQMESPNLSETMLGYILSRGTMEMPKIISTLTEIMMASVDSTTHTTHVLLWEIGRQPELQDKMREEITALVNEKEVLTYQDLEKLPFTVAVIKEVLRLYPAGVAMARISQEDGIIQGYRIPAKTSLIMPLYVIGRNPEVYPDPDELRPERWLRSEGKDSKQPLPFAFVPFGVGQRSCVGRRLAMTEMQLFTVELLRRYKVSTTTPELKLVLRTTLTTPDPVQLTMSDLDS